MRILVGLTDEACQYIIESQENVDSELGVREDSSFTEPARMIDLRLQATLGAAQWAGRNDTIVREARKEKEDNMIMCHFFDSEVSVHHKAINRRNTTRFALPNILPPPDKLSRSCRVIHSGFQAVDDDNETLEKGETWTMMAVFFRDQVVHEPASSVQFPCTTVLPTISALFDALVGRRR